MDGHDRLLTAFLTGALDPASARRWDEHLLECEQCWAAVRADRAGRQAAGLLRQPAPPGLADRVAFAVEMAARQQATDPGHRPGRARSRGWRGWRPFAGAGAVAAGLAVTAVLMLLPGHQTGNMPATVAAVARYAQAIQPPEPGERPRPTLPQQVGRPVTLTVDGQEIKITVWKLRGTEAVTAVSARQFPMPAGAEAASGGGMAWRARLGSLGLYCINGTRSELIAAPVPDDQLAALAASLPAT